MTQEDIQSAIDAMRQRLRENPDAKTLKVTLRRGTAELFLDFLLGFDPDMPSPPLCKALGPMVGDYVMNRKLDRLDDLADRLGPALIAVEMLVRQGARR